MARNKNPNTNNMIAYKKQESQIKREAVLSVLKELVVLDDPIYNPITKAEICRRSNVSKTFLYSYPDELVKPINDAIKRQNQSVRVILCKSTFSESSKDKLVESLKRRIKILEEENRTLRSDKAILLGKLSI